MKKNRGNSLVEVIISLSLNSLIMVLVATTMQFWITNYKKSSSTTGKMEEAYEALMYIDYYIKSNCSTLYVKDNELHIKTDDDVYDDYICQDGHMLRVYYMINPDNPYGEETEYTKEPLLYDVEEFKVKQEKNVVDIEIVLKGDIVVEKSFSKI